MSFTLYIAISGNEKHPINKTLGERWDWEKRPFGILNSFVYVKDFRKLENWFSKASSYMLDSGAYSVWKSGKVPDIEGLIAEAKNPPWNHVIALDVINDPKASIANAKYMTAHGANVVPVFHFGDPFEDLEWYCANYEYVGLSCRFGETVTQSMAWCNEAFKRHFPHKFHSFGWVAKQALMEFPFWSADSASPSVGTFKYGMWKSLGNQRMRFPGKKLHEVDASYELEFYWDLSEEVRAQWSNVWSSKKGPGPARSLVVSHPNQLTLLTEFDGSPDQP